MLKTTFPTVYNFVNSDFRPCCYGVARCIILKKIVHTYQDNAHSNHIATGSSTFRQLHTFKTEKIIVNVNCDQHAINLKR